MNKRNQSGGAQIFVIVAVLMSVLFVAASIFGLLMFTQKSDLQKNMDAKVDAAVVIESKTIEEQKEAEFAEKEKSPTKTYIGPATFGSVSFDYPKTYSAYIIEGTTSTGTPLDGFLHPNIVPKDDKSVAFALRFQLIASPYETQLKTYDALLKSGKLTIKAYRSAKVPDVLGVRVEGEIATGKQVSLILLPVRDKTLKIWTESKETIADFDKYVMASLSFVP